MLPPVIPGSPACCCSAAPAFQVVLPPRADRPSAPEILFCGHHYRRHRHRLLAQGAATYDCTGWPIADSGGGAGGAVGSAATRSAVMGGDRR
jgi:hypothetical protein